MQTPDLLVLLVGVVLLWGSLISHLLWRYKRRTYPHRSLLDYSRIIELEALVWGEAYHRRDGSCDLAGYVPKAHPSQHPYYSEQRPTSPPPKPSDIGRNTDLLSKWKQAQYEVDLARERKARQDHREYMERAARIEREEWTRAAEKYGLDPHVSGPRAYEHEYVEVERPDGETDVVRMAVEKKMN